MRRSHARTSSLLASTGRSARNCSTINLTVATLERNCVVVVVVVPFAICELVRSLTPKKCGLMSMGRPSTSANGYLNFVQYSQKLLSLFRFVSKLFCRHHFCSYYYHLPHLKLIVRTHRDECCDSLSNLAFWCYRKYILGALFFKDFFLKT